MNKQQKAERQEARDKAIQYLRSIIKPGDTIFLVCTESSKRGGWSAYSVMVPVLADGKPDIENISRDVAVALDLKRTDDGAVKSHGWGLSRSYEIVYSLGRILFPEGFVPAKAGMRGRNGTPATALDPDGGYALCERLM